MLSSIPVREAVEQVSVYETGCVPQHFVQDFLKPSTTA